MKERQKAMVTSSPFLQFVHPCGWCGTSRPILAMQVFISNISIVFCAQYAVQITLTIFAHMGSLSHLISDYPERNIHFSSLLVYRRSAPAKDVGVLFCFLSFFFFLKYMAVKLKMIMVLMVSFFFFI